MATAAGKLQPRLQQACANVQGSRPKAGVVLRASPLRVPSAHPCSAAHVWRGTLQKALRCPSHLAPPSCVAHGLCMVRTVRPQRALRGAAAAGCGGLDCFSNHKALGRLKAHVTELATGTQLQQWPVRRHPKADRNAASPWAMFSPHWGVRPCVVWWMQQLWQ